MLLTYSTKSLAEISSYLCFSSQPHFQSLFKKAVSYDSFRISEKIRCNGYYTALVYPFQRPITKKLTCRFIFCMKTADEVFAKNEHQCR